MSQMCPELTKFLPKCRSFLFGKASTPPVSVPTDKRAKRKGKTNNALSTKLCLKESQRTCLSNVCSVLLEKVQKQVLTCSCPGQSPQHEQASRGSPSCHRPSAPSSCSSGTPPCQKITNKEIANTKKDRKRN